MLLQGSATMGIESWLGFRLLGTKIAVERWREHPTWAVSVKALVLDTLGNHELGSLPRWSNDSRVLPEPRLHPESGLSDFSRRLFVRCANDGGCAVGARFPIRIGQINRTKAPDGHHFTLGFANYRSR